MVRARVRVRVRVRAIWVPAAPDCVTKMPPGLSLAARYRGDIGEM